MKMNRFATFAWFVLGCALVVIMWGVVVRATGSGAGCGNHWPKCNGELVPSLEEMKTVIEFSHRFTSSLFGLLAIALAVWAYRAYPKGSLVRIGAVSALFLTIFEGLLGAQLVRLELVADNASTTRAIWMAGHLVNTFILLAAFTLTAWWASGGQALRWREQGRVLALLAVGVVALLLLGISGAVTALGDTLFPAGSVVEGIQQDLSEDAHFLIQLRVIHPILAIATGIYLVFAARMISQLRANFWTSRFSQAVSSLFFIQLLAGALNLVLLAPIWMQLLHLLLADLVWITFILLAATALAHDPIPLNAMVPLRKGHEQAHETGKSLF